MASATVNFYPPVLSGTSGDVTLQSSETHDILLTDAATVTAPNIITLTHTTSGTAAAGFGATEVWQLEAGSGTTRTAMTQATTWTTATDATPTAATIISLNKAGTVTQVISLAPDQVIIPGGINASNPGLKFNVPGNVGIHAESGGNTMYLLIGGGLPMVWTSTIVQLANGAGLQVGVGELNTDGDNQQLRWLCNADTNAPLTTRVYNRRASATSYERFTVDWTTTLDTCLVGTEKGSGGGSSREFALQVDGTKKFRMNATGIGFFATAPAAAQTSGANLTNNVTSGGTDDTIADFTSLTVYATDAAAIRNDIYQLARKVKQINDGLRVFGLLT